MSTGTPAAAEKTPEKESSKSSKGSGDAVKAELKRAEEAKKAEDERQEEMVKAQAEASAAHYEEWVEKGGDIPSKQSAAAEQIMRQPGPTGDTTDHEGNIVEAPANVGDPLKGPSS